MKYFLLFLFLSIRTFSQENVTYVGGTFYTSSSNVFTLKFTMNPIEYMGKEKHLKIITKGYKDSNEILKIELVDSKQNCVELNNFNSNYKIKFLDKNGNILYENFTENVLIDMPKETVSVILKSETDTFVYKIVKTL